MSSASPESRAAAPRACLVSLRGVNRLAAWGSNYEFEDVIGAIDDVDLFTVEPAAAHALRRALVRRLIWRKGLRTLTPYINPGVSPIRLTRKYDLFAFVCMNPADLIYLSAVDGWRDCAATKVCFMVEFYVGALEQYAYHLSLLRQFDHVVFCWQSNVAPVERVTGRPCHHVPLGADLFRFTPYPQPPQRCIDVYSMGRRPEAVHDVLRGMAADREIFYIHDTIPGGLVQPKDHREHRTFVANCAQRSQFFLTYPAKVDMTEETGGQYEIGARYYEGAAAGALLVGQSPTSATFPFEFDWPDAVVDIGTTEESVRSALAPFLSDPRRAEAVRRRNAAEALLRFDWSYRWKDVLRIAGLEPTARHVARERRLIERAAQAEGARLSA